MLNELENITFHMQQKPPRQPAAMTSRDISIAREKTVMDILNLAIKMKITSGKVSNLMLDHLTPTSFLNRTQGTRRTG